MYININIYDAYKYIHSRITHPQTPSNKLFLEKLYALCNIIFLG